MTAMMRDSCGRSWISAWTTWTRERHANERIELLAKGIDGVRSVVGDLKIRPGDSSNKLGRQHRKRKGDMSNISRPYAAYLATPKSVRETYKRRFYSQFTPKAY
jgi:hypothetical protein